MTSTTLDWTIEKGADAALGLTWLDSAGAAIDISSWTATLSIRERWGERNTLATLTKGAGLTLGSTGTVDAWIAAANVLSLFPDDWTGEYSLLLKNGSYTYPAAHGAVIVKRAVAS